MRRRNASGPLCSSLRSMRTQRGNASTLLSLSCWHWAALADRPDMCCHPPLPVFRCTRVSSVWGCRLRMAGTLSLIDSPPLSGCPTHTANLYACRSRPLVGGRWRCPPACQRCCTVRSFAACQTVCATPFTGGPRLWWTGELPPTPARLPCL
eukprot:79767-Chlamydomonas_euryale.AAC.1